MSGARLLVVCALVLARVLSTEGQSEGLLDNSTLREWNRLAFSTSSSLAGGGERQYLFTGLRFRCNGNVTKWIVGAAFGGTSRTWHPALGIYRDRAGGGFADRVGATVLAPTNSISSRIYEFTPAPPLPFQTNDSLGIYLHPFNELRLRPLHRQVTDGPASRNYDPSDPPTEGVSTFRFDRDPTEETNRFPLVAVEITSDDPDSADCTRDFISRDLLELFAPPNLGILSNRQIVFPSYNFASDGNVTSWTVAADWIDGAGRIRFPELQIWRRRSGDTYDRVASTNLAATAQSPNQLYSGTIDPPLQFLSGDLLGMYHPPDVSNGARLLVLFAPEVGQTYETRTTGAPLTSITFSGLETGNDRPILVLEISGPETDPTAPTTPAASTSIIPVTSASPPTTAVPSASPPTELLPVIAIAVGASVGGVALAAVTVLIIVTAVACARKKSQNPTDRSVDAINMTATAEETYDYPFHEPTAVATKRNEPYATTAITTEQNEAYVYATTAITTEPNEAYAITTEQNEAYATTAITTEQNEAYATTAITTEQNEAYASTAITTEQNEAYATTRGGDTATDEYEYI